VLVKASYKEFAREGGSEGTTRTPWESRFKDGS